MRPLLILVAVLIGLAAAITIWVSSSPVQTDAVLVSSDAGLRAADVIDFEVAKGLDAGFRFRVDDAFCDPVPGDRWRWAIKNDTLIVEHGKRWSTAPWAVKMPGDWSAQFMRDRTRAARKEAFLRAQRLVPDDVSSAMALVLETRSDPTPDEALAHLDVVLKSVDSRELDRMRAMFVVARDLQRDYARVESGGLTIAWDSRTIDETEARSILELVHATRREAGMLSGQWDDTELSSIVVYPSKSELLAVSCAPEWAGGLYDGTIRLIVEKSGKVRLDAVRHEAAHSMLWNSVVAPHWVHEGLAQTFEFDRLESSARILRWMIAHDVWIDVDRLDAAIEGDDARIAIMAYAESFLLIRKLKSCDERAVSKMLDGFAHRESTQDIFTHICGELPSKVNGLAFANSLVRE
ncbi:MAG: DUF1570 domain-containing protein [Archangium sp.]|nr:DUF1570 domain-containing protein [Archangium sp.]